MLSISDQDSQSVSFSVKQSDMKISVHSLIPENLEDLDKNLTLTLNSRFNSQKIRLNTGELSTNLPTEISEPKLKEKLTQYLEFFDDLECSSLEVLQHKILNEQSLDFAFNVKSKFFSCLEDLTKAVADNFKEFLEFLGEYEEAKGNKYLEELEFNIRGALHSFEEKRELSTEELNDLLEVFEI